MAQCDHYDYAPMSNGIPKIIDAQSSTVKQSLVEGELFADSLPRLAAADLSLTGGVMVTFKFGGQAGLKIPHVRVSAHANLSTRCERCNQDCVIAVDPDVEYVIASSPEKEKEYESRFENVLFCEESKLDTIKLLEDEIILALPLVKKHEVAAECKVKLQYGEPVSGDDVKPNPFAELAKLKKN